MQKIYDIIVFILLLLLVGSLTGIGIQTYRLERARQQLEHVRMELTTAENRQYELAEILRRDGKILSESSSTVAGIRKQIKDIRESYEEMEKLLLSSGAFNLYNNNHSGSVDTKE